MLLTAKPQEQFTAICKYVLGTVPEDNVVSENGAVAISILKSWLEDDFEFERLLALCEFGAEGYHKGLGEYAAVLKDPKLKWTNMPNMEKYFEGRRLIVLIYLSRTGIHQMEALSKINSELHQLYSNFERNHQKTTHPSGIEHEHFLFCRSQTVGELGYILRLVKQFGG